MTAEQIVSGCIAALAFAFGWVLSRRRSEETSTEKWMLAVRSIDAAVGAHDGASWRFVVFEPMHESHGAVVAVEIEAAAACELDTAITTVIRRAGRAFLGVTPPVNWRYHVGSPAETAVWVPA